MAKGRKTKVRGEDDPYDFDKPLGISDDELKVDDGRTSPYDVDYNELDPDVKEMLREMPEEDDSPYATRGKRKLPPRGTLDREGLDDDDEEEEGRSLDDYNGFPEDDEMDEF